MMLKRMEFIARVNIDEETLEIWLSEQWLLPLHEEDEEAFTEADIARARLVADVPPTKRGGTNQTPLGCERRARFAPDSRLPLSDWHLLVSDWHLPVSDWHPPEPSRALLLLGGLGAVLLRRGRKSV